MAAEGRCHKFVRLLTDLKHLVIPGWIIIRNYNFSNENLAILDSYKTIFKILATENRKKQNRYFYNAASNCPIYTFISYKYSRNPL